MIGKAKMMKVLNFLLGRLGEKNTWQGIGFFVGAFISKDLGNLDWGAAALVGGAVSGAIKIITTE